MTKFVLAWLRSLWRAWLQFWFTPSSTCLLDAIRIGLGLVLLTLYLGPVNSFYTLWGNDGWVSVAAARDLVEGEWSNSLLFYLSERWQQAAFFATFLAACMAFTLGWRTRWVKWLVLIGHISLIHRNPAITYGLDNILASLLWILCLAPLGYHLSLDRVRQRRLAKRINLTASGDDAPPSAWGNACLRLMQWQMTVVFFTAGAAKLQGDSWLHGYAFWDALVNYQYTNIPLTLVVLADQFWLVNLLTYATIVLQLAYPFLIWGEHRKWLLAEAIVIHLGIAVLMGLYVFSTAMIFGHLAFTRECWLDALAQKWRECFGGMELIYDGRCAFQQRMMATFLAFDGFNQIALRDFNRHPLTEALTTAPCLMTSGGDALFGLDAYRYAVLRVPGLWWLVPLLYIPLLSRAASRCLAALDKSTIHHEAHKEHEVVD